MTRRESVRIVLFARGLLHGDGSSVRCAVVDLSAGGALLAVTGKLPEPPLRLEFELGGETHEFPVEILRYPPGSRVAVTFPRPPAEKMFRLIAAEQRHALAQGRINISDRRKPSSFKPPSVDGDARREYGAGGRRGGDRSDA
jgi:hypothetical protein